MIRGRGRQCTAELGFLEESDRATASVISLMSSICAANGRIAASSSSMRTRDTSIVAVYNWQSSVALANHLRPSSSDL